MIVTSVYENLVKEVFGSRLLKNINVLGRIFKYGVEVNGLLMLVFIGQEYEFITITELYGEYFIFVDTDCSLEENRELLQMF